MSKRTDNKNDRNQAAHRNEPPRKLFARIIAVVIAALILGGSIFYTIYFSIFGARAAETDRYRINSEGDMSRYVAVGLMYGADVTVGFEIRALEGFVFGSSAATRTERRFDPIFSVPDVKISVTCDANLSKKGMTYSIANNESSAAVGSYHVQFDVPADKIIEIESFLHLINSKTAPGGYAAFPAYIRGSHKIRVGQFTSAAAAEEAIPAVRELLGGEFELTVAAPSPTGTSAVNPETDVILFEFDGGESGEYAEYAMGICAVQNAGNDVYILTPANNTYEGVFVFKRHTTGSVDGVLVINLLALDGYVKGVLPWEISSSWPVEVQRAFAVTVRSFAAANILRHYNTYGFDVCNSTHCQKYMGCNRLNDSVKHAVESTSGDVLTYNGAIISSYYSSISGGETVTATDAWGGANLGCFVSQQTPWEKYAELANGLWSVEVDPAELLQYLRDVKGYTKLRGSVASIKINSCAGDTGYVNSVTVTDTYGGSVTVSTTDAVRTLFTRYVKSSNFVVSKGKAALVYDEVTYSGAESKPAAAMEGMHIVGGAGQMVNGLQSAGIITSGGIISQSEAVVLTAGNADELLGESETGDEDGVKLYNTGNLSIKTHLTEKTMTVTASKSGNFVFVGKGNGHGVGMSQQGARDLALLGISAEDILQVYYPGTEVVGLDSFK